jgi:predicted ATPase
MSIDRIAVAEFKCFRAAEIALAPLTLLTGFNAAGKSTTLQSLLLLSQGLRSSPESKFLPLNGPLVRLGSAGEVVRHGGRGEMKFRVEGFGAVLEWEVVAGLKDNLDEPTSKERLEVVALKADGISVCSPKEPVRMGPPRGELRTAIADVIFLGAARHGRQDVFPSPDEAEPVHGDVGSEGQFAPWLYVGNADNLVERDRQFPGESAVTFRGQVDAWLGHLFPGASANAEAIAGASYSRLEFRLGRSSGWSRPANIGYGLSYAFPLVVALLSARRGQVVVIDSPEAHLHPRAQSRMGEMLATFANAGIQLLVETHSDHVLSGARLAVQQKKLVATDLAIHFFSGNADENEHGIISPVIYPDGRLSDWPEGFFDQADIDLATLAAS